MFHRYVDLKEYHLDRILKRYFARIMGTTMLVSYLTLLVYASFYNRFSSFCLVDHNHDLRLDKSAVDVNIFAIHVEYPTLVNLIVGLGAKTSFNLFRALALYMVIFCVSNDILETNIGIYSCYYSNLYSRSFGTRRGTHILLYSTI